MSTHTKVCSGCGIDKPLTDYLLRGGSGKFSYLPRGRCKICTGIVAKATVDKEGAYARRIFSEYGITLKDYNGMLEQQGGLCKLCFSPPAKGKRLFVDHCHTTSKVRGLLCTHCNTMLGAAKDNVETLQRAIAYLNHDA